MIEFGLHEAVSYDDTLARFPKTTHVREFVGGKLTPGTDLVYKINRLATPALSKGLTPWVSFKLLPTDVASGAWDDELERVATEVDVRVKLIPWHEPENDMDADDFVDMFERVTDELRMAGGMHDVVYSAMAYQFRPGSENTTDPAAWFPPSADIYAADVYSGKSFPLTAILPEHEGFARWKETVDSLGVPWAITERGFITASYFATRSATIQREADWLKDQSCEAYIYWNTSGTEGNDDIVLDSTGEQAVRELSEVITAAPVEEPAPDCTQAYDDGYANGYADGKAVGQSAAYNSGYDLGVHDGTVAGKQEAWNLLQAFLDGQD